MNKIVLATNNKHKLKEYKAILCELGIEVISQQEIGVNIDIEETGETFEENASLKAEALYNEVKIPVIADDSGIIIDFLNGMPGVYSHRFLRREYT